MAKARNTINPHTHTHTYIHTLVYWLHPIPIVNRHHEKHHH